MGVLLVGLSRALGEALVTRLLDASDTVSVIEDDETLAAAWTELGAHVAHGPPVDADLVERAAQNARTVVVVQRAGADLAEVTLAALRGAAAASPDMRIVLCAPRVDPSVANVVVGSGLQHVILHTGGRLTRVLRRDVDVAALAAAVDAADDLAGAPRLDLDLRERSSWSELGLEPPGTLP
jgi:hypothetical protein